MVINLPPKKRLRNEIYWNGPKNGLQYADDRVANSVFGVPKSHISFVKQTHRHITRYDEAQEDLRAASVTLVRFHNYYVEHPEDSLFQEYYRVYRQVVATGSEEDIGRCKEIHQFVRYPELDYPYEFYSLEWLREAALYKTVVQYPYDYIMLYDILNEFDLKLSKADKEAALLEYGQEYLADEPYQNGNPQLADRLEPALRRTAKMIRGNIKERIKTIIHQPETNQKRLGHISNAACGVGNKRSDFFAQLAVRGIRPELQEQVELDFQRLEYLYGIKLERPKISEYGLTRREYLPNCIAREDPKKPRIAYQDGPIQDYIGYPGMDVLTLVFESLPFCQCGRKRESIEDAILDKHRYDAIQAVLNHNHDKGRYTVSTDLTKATEHLNMLTIHEVMVHFLGILLPELDCREIDTWCRMTFGQLYLTPVIIQGIPELRDELLYTKEGQLQGTPGSFHSMTFVLALINIQACLESGIAFEDAIMSTQENGDDGTLPEQALDKYQEILELITGPGVFNREKSFSSSINGSLEFCKTIVYSSNPDLITGYRFSTLYKLCRDPNALLYLQSPKFAHERSVCYRFLQYMESQDDWLSANERIDFTVSLCMFEEVEVLTQVVVVNQLYQQFAIQQLLLKDTINVVSPYDRLCVPTTWLQLCHHNKTYQVISEGNIAVADLKVLNQYHSEIEEKFPISRRELYIASPERFKEYLDYFNEEWSLIPQMAFHIKEVNDGILFRESAYMVAAPAVLVRMSEGNIQNVVVAPKVATQFRCDQSGQMQMSDEILAEIKQTFQSLETMIDVSLTTLQLSGVESVEVQPIKAAKETAAEKAAQWMDTNFGNYRKVNNLSFTSQGASN